jgi:hypothetical protein
LFLTCRVATALTHSLPQLPPARRPPNQHVTGSPTTATTAPTTTLLQLPTTRAVLFAPAVVRPPHPTQPTSFPPIPFKSSNTFEIECAIHTTTTPISHPHLSIPYFGVASCSWSLLPHSYNNTQSQATTAPLPNGHHFNTSSNSSSTLSCSILHTVGSAN